MASLIASERVCTCWILHPWSFSHICSWTPWNVSHYSSWCFRLECRGISVYLRYFRQRWPRLQLCQHKICSSTVFRSKMTEMKLFFGSITINFYHTWTCATNFLRPLQWLPFIYCNFHPPPTFYRVETQSSRAAIQPGFLTCPVENSLKAVFCLRNHLEKGRKCVLL